MKKIIWGQNLCIKVPILLKNGVYDWSTGESKNKDPIGHFTAVVWDDTTKVGIGMASGSHPEYGTQNYVIAQYTPRKLLY